MKKDAFFLAAMAAQEFRRRAWVISAFSLLQEAPDDWKKEPYAWRIVQTPAGHFFVDPAKQGELTPIEDAKAGEPVFVVNEKINVTPEQVVGVLEETQTTYGRLLTHYTVFVHPFGDKISFMNKRLNPSELENIITPRLQDDPAEGAEVSQDTGPKAPIYVSEYLKFADAMFFLTGFTQLCVPTITPKTMVAAPGIHDLRKKLLEENKDRLHDPAVIAKIAQELIAYDRAYLKGDPGENFLITKKSFDVVRAKLFNMHGAEMGLSDKVDVQLIETSLSEGWDIEKFPLMMDSLRGGSYDRGKQTMLGGESVKWLLRASSNITVAAEDCGSRLGVFFEPNETNVNWLIGFNVIEPNGFKPVVTQEDAKSYFGKRIQVRSPMFCKLDKTDFCSVCVGSRLAENPTGLSVSVSEYGSVFLALFLKSMHGKALALARMEIKTALT